LRNQERKEQRGSSRNLGSSSHGSAAIPSGAKAYDYFADFAARLKPRRFKPQANSKAC
jgi:hypothetical protein